VVLTLPMAGVLKKNFPSCRILFLGRTYTRDVVLVSRHVDEFINYDDLQKLQLGEQAERIRQTGAGVFLHVYPRKSIAALAFRARVRHRAGTRSRWYHWFFCNHLLNLPRQNSNLHESQLNLRMLKFMGIREWFSLKEIPTYYGFENLPELEERFSDLLDPARVNLILHPRSKGSAAEWGLANFGELISLLPSKKYKIFISGTSEDERRMKEFISMFPEALNLCGKLSLSQLIAFISKADALVAASTGPLHIAAALGKGAVGLYSARRPIFPKRWAPLGPKATALTFEKACRQCASGKYCDCIQKIRPAQVKEILDNL
jgi:heptosyltransferase III